MTYDIIIIPDDASGLVQYHCDECDNYIADPVTGRCPDCHICECGEPYPNLRGILNCPVCDEE